MYNISWQDDVDNISYKGNNFDVNLGKIYIFLMLFTFAVIYFYAVYQNNYLSFFAKYSTIWAILLTLVGMSMFKARNKASFISGILIIVFLMCINVTSIFVYSSEIPNNLSKNIIPVTGADSIVLNSTFTFADLGIKSGNISDFKSDFRYNYDELVFENYKDDRNIENINIEQVAFSPGIGAYEKSVDMIWPRSLPITFDIKSDLSFIKSDLSDIKLKSGEFNIRGSKLDLVINDLDIKNESTLNITSTFSQVNLTVSKDISLVLYNTSSFSQNQFSGIIKGVDNVYVSQDANYTESEDIQNIDGKSTKKLIINLFSNMSMINITQK